MSQKVTISMADDVFKEIEARQQHYGFKNRSEFVEELLRLGLIHYKDREYRK